jgi:arsenate reductase
MRWSRRPAQPRRHPNDDNWEGKRTVTDRIYNVLFLCTGNSARSIFGECLLNRFGQGRFRGYSAGSHPKGAVHPLAVEVLKRNNYLSEGLRSKDWAEVATPDSPRMDFFFTVCDRAAAEVCPVWPGQPMTAHWGIADPVAVEGDEVARIMAFRQAFGELQNRVAIFVSLPFESLDKLKLQEKLDEIGRQPTTPTLRAYEHLAGLSRSPDPASGV